MYIAPTPSDPCHDKWKEPKPSARAYLSFVFIISCDDPETQRVRNLPGFACLVVLSINYVCMGGSLFSWYLRGVRRKLDEVPASVDAWQLVVDVAITLLLNIMNVVQINFIGILDFSHIRV